VSVTATPSQGRGSAPMMRNGGEIGRERRKVKPPSSFEHRGVTSRYRIQGRQGESEGNERGIPWKECEGGGVMSDTIMVIGLLENGSCKRLQRARG